MSHTGSHAARRHAEHNGRDKRITYLSGDVLSEEIHTPVGLPPTMEGGDGYARQKVKLINCTSESPHSYALILMNRSMLNSEPPPTMLHERIGREHVTSRVSRQSGPVGAVALQGA